MVGRICWKLLQLGERLNSKVVYFSKESSCGEKLIKNAIFLMYYLNKPIFFESAVKDLYIIKKIFSTNWQFSRNLL